MSYRSKIRFWAAAGALLLSMQIGPASAQSFPLIYGPPSGITGEDIELIRRAVEPLFLSDSIGALARWDNPKSGNTGAVRLRKIYEMKGMSCRELLYTTQYRGKAQPSVTKVDWCKIPSGEWKLVDPLELRGG
jgi:17 kDa outer membrane surface antigen